MKNYVVTLWVEVEKLSEFKVVLDTPIPPISFLVHNVLSDNGFASQLHYFSLSCKWSSSYFMGYNPEEASLIGSANSHQVNWPLCQVTS